MLAEGSKGMLREEVYVSDLLPLNYAAFFRELQRALQSAGTECHFLPGTKDIWVRDFMPLQVSSGQFVQFAYKPDYLRKNARWRKTISDTTEICATIGIEPEKSNLVLDGGNVEKHSRKAILTEKVFLENPGHPRETIRAELARLLRVEQVIIVPQEPGDILGHVDGLVRFLDEETVLVNDYESELERPFAEGLQQVLRESGLQTIPIPYAARYDQNPLDAHGVYLNFLRVRDCILLPVFGIETDRLAFEAFNQLFHGSKILPVLSNAVAEQGGAINCVTWNISTEGRQDVLSTHHNN
jgi:agmatine deiminase